MITEKVNVTESDNGYVWTFGDDGDPIPFSLWAAYSAARRAVKEIEDLIHSEIVAYRKTELPLRWTNH